MSDTVQLAVVTGIITIATLIIKGIIDAHAKKVALVAAAEAAKVTQKLEAVEIKIDGRLTQLLELTQRSYFAEGKIEGKAEEKDKHIESIAPPTPTGGDISLKIHGGELNVTTDPKKPLKPKK